VTVAVRRRARRDSLTGAACHGVHRLRQGVRCVAITCCLVAAPAGATAGAQTHSTVAGAQTHSPVAAADSAPVRHVLYGELFGNALFLGSVNYEAMLTRRLSARVGASPFGAFPIMLNYLVPDGPHRLEAGAGVLATRSGVGGTATLGYRLQPLTEGMVFRAGITPWVARGGIAWWGGISIGAAW
jgi:hypothetical protein